ncbi:MAG: pyrroline-5-carboxylate reductase, partial [Treponema sp.]|nr:pyrroline-5-carboxylate reductase [Treponema sp.]
NTPVQIGEGMTALCHSENISKDNLDTIIKILECSGRVEIVSESLFDAVTAVSGSGPAYAFVFIEALADAAVRCGLSRKQAYLYASQTLRGAASMVLQSGNSPAQLKDAVCSPGGTTIEALAALENGGFRASVYDAVQAAFEKSRKISSAN